MREIVPITESDWRKDYRFAVYEHRLVTGDGLSYTRSFIVIKNRYDVIVRFTRLHNFAGAYENRIYRPLASDANARMHYITMMLNHILIDHHEIYRIDHVFKVTKEMLTCFFMDYGKTGSVCFHLFPATYIIVSQFHFWIDAVIVGKSVVIECFVL